MNWKNSSESEKQPLLNPFLRFLLLAIVLFTILVLRKPDSLSNPQFFAEDGQIFYADQLILGWRSVLVPYNGYLSLITRLAAGIESLFPAAIAPLLCCLVGLTVQASSYAVVILPAFRYLIQSDLVRLAIALVLTTSLDGVEMIGNSLNSQWHVILPGLLLLLLPNAGGRNRISDALIAAATGIISLSASILVIVLPIALFRAVSRTGRERLIASVFTFGFIVQICFFVATSPTMHPGGAAPPIAVPLSASAISAFVAWLVRVVFTDTLGKPMAIDLSSKVGSGGIAIAFFLVLAALAWLFHKAGKSRRLTLLLACYFTASSIVVTLATRHLLDLFQPGAVRLFMAPRYFTLSAYVFLFVIASVLDSAPRRIPDFAKALALCGLFSSGIISNFPVQPYADLHWAASAPAIDRWTYDRDHGLPNAEVRAPIYPESWAISLPALSRTR